MLEKKAKIHTILQFTPHPLMLVECTPVSIVNYRQGVGSIHRVLFSTRIVTCELTTRRSSFLYAAEERAQPKILFPQKTVVPVMRPLSRTASGTWLKMKVLAR